MWARFANVLIGIWLMAAPAVIGYDDPARTNDRVMGPVVASFAIIAMWEVTRPLRWVNLAFGLWLIIAPWLLGYGLSVAGLNSSIAGALIALFSFIRGEIKGEYSGGWSSLWRRAGGRSR